MLLSLVLPADDTASITCVPVGTKAASATPSAIEEHRRLRTAIGEPMPQAREMIMLLGRGGHLITYEYSIVLARRSGGAWHGTAVGRSRIWIDDAPYEPMQRIEWFLDRGAGRKLDAALHRRCPAVPPAAAIKPTEPPPLGKISERVDVVSAGRSQWTFDADAAEPLVKLIRPPRAAEQPIARYRPGNQKLNRAPCPGALSTVRSPPIARARRRAM
ncbi:hypothetical protein [Sphingomonas sp.]|uniref:hypothetical protein n=1 Tax=Sphingomonas sp. TaxID=28214 RepID=UPI0025E5E34F|nr:hypothetical protein [Sphingomonas sp.]